MKGIIGICAAAAVLTLCAGCRTMTMRVTPGLPGQTSQAGNPVQWNIRAENRGLFLFNWIPLVTGNPYRPNAGGYNFFTNRMRPYYLEMIVRGEAEKRKTPRVEDLRQTERSTGAFTLWLVWLRVQNIQGVATVKALPQPEKGGVRYGKPSDADSVRQQ